MERVVRVNPAGQWPAREARDSVTLPYDARHRRRLRLTTDGGRDFLLDLPEATVMRDGDGIALEGGEWVVLRAAEETLAEISCALPQDLARIAWHLGNRHILTEILQDRLLIRNDHVIVDMARRLGARVHIIEAPFDPEGGAYRDAHGDAHEDQVHRNSDHQNRTGHGSSRG